MKKAVTLLSALVILQTVYIAKSLNTPAGKYKNITQREEEALLHKLKNLGIEVKALTKEEKLNRIFRVDIRNGRSFYSSVDGRYYIFGDVIDTVLKKAIHHNEEESQPMKSVMINAQDLPDKKTALENVEKQLKALSSYRDYLRKEQ